MHPRTARWLSAARTLHHIKVTSSEGCACRTTVDTVAVAKRVAAIEKCCGIALPPSYREFMLRYDGWSRVFGRASLLSTEQLLSPSWHHRAEIVMDRVAGGHMPPAGKHHPNSASSWRNDNLIPFGLDDTGSVLFVFDADKVDESGEFEVLAWFSGLGVRVPSFPWLLDMLCDLSSSRSSVVPEAAIRAA